MEVDISDKVNRLLKYGAAGIVLLALLAGAAAWWWQSSQAYLTFSNARIAGALVKVQTKVSGRLVELPLADGTRVEPGQILAKLEAEVSPEARKALESAAAEAQRRYAEIEARPAQIVAAAGADIGTAEAAADKARQQRERMDKLFAIGAVSAVERQRAAKADEAAQAALSAARRERPAETSADRSAVLQAAQAQLQRAQAALEAAKQPQLVQIAAPVEGTLYREALETGMRVEAGQTLFHVGDLQNTWVELFADEAQRENLQLGNFVEYTIEPFGSRTFQGTIYEIAETENNEEGALPKYTVRISLPDDPDLAVRPGMQVRAKVAH